MGAIEIHCRIGGWYYRHDFYFNRKLLRPS